MCEDSSSFDLVTEYISPSVRATRESTKPQNVINLIEFLIEGGGRQNLLRLQCAHRNGQINCVHQRIDAGISLRRREGHFHKVSEIM